MTSQRRASAEGPSSAGEARSGGGLLVSVFDAIGREDELADTPANRPSTLAGIVASNGMKDKVKK